MYELKLNQLVNYRYMSYAPGYIRDIRKGGEQVLLEVSFGNESFSKWVHWTSVNPEPIRRPVKVSFDRYIVEQPSQMVSAEKQTPLRIKTGLKQVARPMAATA